VYETRNETVVCLDSRAAVPASVSLGSHTDQCASLFSWLFPGLTAPTGPATCSSTRPQGWRGSTSTSGEATALPDRVGPVDTALVVACISGVVALASAVFTGWTQLQVSQRERESKEAERHSEAKAVLDRYRGPLLDAAWQLGDRVENIRKREFLAYLKDSDRAEDARRSTLFRLAYYLGWREYVRTQVQLLPFEDEKDTRLAAAFLNDVTRILASDQLDGQWTMLWGDEQRGIGELMTEQPPGASSPVRGHAAFHRDYEADFAEWMGRFADDLFTRGYVKSSDRLRLLQWALYGIVRQLDEKNAYGGDWIERSAQEISETPLKARSTNHEQALRKDLDEIKPLTSSSSGSPGGAGIHPSRRRGWRP
jgi:hypothetical protein